MSSNSLSVKVAIQDIFHFLRPVVIAIFEENYRLLTTTIREVRLKRQQLFFIEHAHVCDEQVVPDDREALSGNLRV